MKTIKTEDFDQAFDEGKDITEFLDIQQAKRVRVANTFAGDTKPLDSEIEKQIQSLL